MGVGNLKAHAEAARDTGSVLWICGYLTREQVAMCVETGAKVVQVIKPYQDEDVMYSLMHQAEELGCVAVASDLDHAYGRNGELDKPHEYTFEPKSSEQLRQIVASVHIPFIAKGVLSVQDAVKCRAAGVAAVLLSHHHSIMDCAVPPVMILPQVREAVGPDYPIIVDCSIDTGADAFKALAMGADAVCTARAVMKIMKGGKTAMTDFMNGMTGSLRSFMNRTSSPDVKHIDPAVIHYLPM